jgi:hypothetical protein
LPWRLICGAPPHRSAAGPTSAGSVPVLARGFRAWYAGAMRAQPRGREGTPDRPYSALNLRLALAAFGLIVSMALAVLAFRRGYPLLGWLSVLVAVTAVVDLLVVQSRRSARRRTSGGDGPS